MNLAACQQLPLAPATGHWYRAIQPKHWATLLQTKQTEEHPTRFNPAQTAPQPFQTLYLAQTRDLTLWEGDATVGVWHRPGGAMSVPGITWIILDVTVNLQHIADLTDPANQQLLEITAQELTGDWRGYEWRGSHTQVPHPVGIAPTQELGMALHAVPDLQGFYTISAKVPLYKALVVFPDKLVGTSFVDFSDPGPPPRRARIP